MTMSTDDTGRDSKQRAPAFMRKALIAYAGVCALFFWPVLLPDRVLFGSDFLMFFYPMKQFLWEQVRDHGRLPLWNPHVFCGAPFLADIQVSAIYPGGALFYAMPPEQAYGWTVALHFFAAALGMFAFTRDFGLSWPASWTAGVLYAFNAFMLRHVYAGHLTLFQTAAWVPWLWWACRRAWSSDGTRGWALASVFTALMLLGGFPQIAFYALLFLLGMAVFNAPAAAAVSLRRRMTVFAVSVGAGFAIAGVQLLPTAEFTAWSTRSDGILYEAAVSDSLRGVDLFNLFFPMPFGSPPDGTYWGTPTVTFFWETGAYTGLLAVAAIFGFSWRSASRIERYAFGVLILSVFLAMGKHNPVFPAYHALPIVRNFRVPSQILFLSATALSILAAALLDRITGGASIPLRRMALLILALAIAVVGLAAFPQAWAEFPKVLELYAAGSLSRSLAVCVAGLVCILILAIAAQRRKIGVRAACALLAALTLGDMYWEGRRLIQPTDSVARLKADRDAILSLSGAERGGGRRVSVSGSYVFGNTTMLTGQLGVRGYNPLVLSSYVRFLLATWGQSPEREDFITLVPPIERIDRPAQRLLSLGLAVNPDRFEAIAVPGAMPRAFWVGTAAGVPEDSALQWIASPEFDPARTVLLTDRASGPGGAAVVPPARTDTPPTGRILEEVPDRLKIEVDAPDTGYLVVNDVYYPGWRASLDGARVSILRANYAFRAVPVPAGRHGVEMWFAPVSLALGAALSMLGVALAAFFACRAR